MNSKENENVSVLWALDQQTARAYRVEYGQANVLREKMHMLCDQGHSVWLINPGGKKEIPVYGHNKSDYYCSKCDTRLEMSDGWVPSFNDPDNSGLVEASEPFCPKCDGLAPTTDAVAKEIGKLAASWFNHSISTDEFIVNAEAQFNLLRQIEREHAASYNVNSVATSLKPPELVDKLRGILITCDGVGKLKKEEAFEQLLSLK